jgi:uncharacterized protein
MGKKSLTLVFLLVAGYSLLIRLIPLSAQSSGDQFLDGIGETALLARYLLDGNSDDRSRNHFHAVPVGGEAVYVEEKPFGKVLALSGNGLQLPGRTLVGAESLSVTGWVLLKPGAKEQRLFEFANGTGASFVCELTGADGAPAIRARILPGGPEIKLESPMPLPPNRWIHLTLVLDAAGRTMSGYIYGRPAGRTENANVSLDQFRNRRKPAANRFYIGRAPGSGRPGLEAKLHDLRLYSVALSEAQASTIFRNALGLGEGGPPKVESPKSTPVRSLAQGLQGVPDIVVETTAGVLPHLPAFVPGTYAGATAGSLVRVIWPAPVDNAEVQKPGTYTVTGTVPGTAFRPTALITVKPAPASVVAPQRRLETFSLGEVSLERDEQGRDTPFIKNRDKFIRALAKSNPDNFLYNFRDAFGVPQPAGVVPLGIWDDQTTRLRGHASGHYLSAIAQACAGVAPGSEMRANFLQKMNYMIDTLYDLTQKSGRPAEPGGPCNPDPTAVPPGPGKSDYDSDLSPAGLRHDYWNWGTGFISAYPPDQFIMLEKGATYGANNSQIWAPYYTLHKILAGLLDCYEVGGNQKALEIAEGMGTWALKRLQAVPAETRTVMWSRYMAGEFGGINEVMARLYRLTGKPEYLACAKLFDNTNFFFGNSGHQHGLARNVDNVRGRHANQHIPQITGALEIYRDSREPVYFDVAANFWDIFHDHYMYSIGGVAGARNPNNAECFTAQPDTLFANGFSMEGQNETCGTYNLLKLSRQLFLYNPVAKYMDYYEQALYNHILASVGEHDAGNTYHVSLTPGARKSYDNAGMDGFTCCNGTALESNTKLQDSIYFRSADNRELFVNLFVPSTLTWKERNLVLTQKTSFPYADRTDLVLSGGGKFALHVRVPAWATRGFFVSVNGRELKVKAVPGTYLTLERTWKAGDTISLRMPFSFRLDSVMDQPNVASIFYGPVLLAVEESGLLPAWRPVTLDKGDIAKSIQGDPATLRFTTNGLSLKPFYESYGNYSVYLDVTLE